MTPKQQHAYWLEYAKQNAKMERTAYVIFMRHMREVVSKIAGQVENNGIQGALNYLDSFDIQIEVRRAYSDIYLAVGEAQKKWADKDVKSRVLSKKEDEDERFRRRPNPLNIQNQQVPTSFGIGFFNPDWLARLRSIINSQEVGKRVNSVSDTIKKKIRKSLEESSQQFVSIRKVISKLRRDVGDISRQRAEVIARTETTFISNIAAEQSAKETGLKLMKIWIHTRDARTRDAHRKVSAKAIKSEEKFLVGGYRLDKPGDPSAPISQTVNCRCVVVYLPADDFEDIESEYLSSLGESQRI